MQDKFYDSDLASINEKDFMSDTEPPKDQLREKKLLKKTKFNRIYKSIYKIGHNIDKPAKYDFVTIRYRTYSVMPQNFILIGDYLEYNLGLSTENEHLQELLISMKKQQVSLFYIENLKICQNTGMKILSSTDYYLIELKNWITTIDLDGDRIYLKQILKKGEGGERVSDIDQIKFSYKISYKQKEIVYNNQNHLILDDQSYEFPNTVLKILKTMKNSEISLCEMNITDFKAVESINFVNKLIDQESDKDKIKIQIEVKDMRKVDDIYFDKKLFKKIMLRGTSTAKPQRTSLIYYAYKFYDQNNMIIKKDQLFDFRQQNLEILETMSVRRNYLDEYKVSRMLKNILIRMKPSEICQVVCKDKSLLKYGEDFIQLMSLFNEIKQPIKFDVKVFNFTQGKSAYNMQIPEKIYHGNRKKQIGVHFLKQNNLKRALKCFEEINAFFCYGIDTPQDKIKVQQIQLSSLLNTSLCYLKLKQYQKVASICEKIKEIKISEKGIYRLAFAYKQLSEYDKAIKQITDYEKKFSLGNELQSLKKDIQIKIVQYNKKLKQRYTNMFS